MKRSLRPSLGLAFLVTLQMAACAPEERLDIDRVADFYVERMFDTLSTDTAATDSLQPDSLSADSLQPDSLRPDSLLSDSLVADSVSDSVFARPLAIDSLTLDSLTADWTAEDWVTFWSKVEQKQARRAEATKKAADP